jgi:4-aminobutyrate aminotransferase-like enzyme
MDTNRSAAETIFSAMDSISIEMIEDYRKKLMVGGGTRGGPVLSHGKGVRVWDVDGNGYIDCTSQSWALYLGYCNEEVWDAINTQAHRMTHVHQGFDTLPRLHLAKRLTDIMPGGMNRVSFCPSSGLALEAAMKLAIKNRPGSSHFMSLWDGYHGTTLGTMGASWVSTASNGSYVGGSRFLPLTQNFIRVPNPYCYRCHFGLKQGECGLMCAKMLELTIQKGVNGPPAGFIMEPIQASAGQIPCPKDYVKEVRRICDQYSIPLIFDEIQTYMRIGSVTAAEHYGVTPDAMAFGKAIGGGLPLGATVLKDGFEGFSPDSEELHTFANSSLAQIGALAQIEIIQRDNILDNVNKIGVRIKDGLVRLQKSYPEIGNIRQVGLHIGVEFVKDPDTKEPLNEQTAAIRNDAMPRGVLFGLAGVRKNLLKIKPPLIINESEADEVLVVLEKSLNAVLRS